MRGLALDTGSSSEHEHATTTAAGAAGAWQQQQQQWQPGRAGSRPPGWPIITGDAGGDGWAGGGGGGGPAMASALLRDVRRLKAAQGTDAERAVLEQLRERYSPNAVAAMLSLGATAREARRASRARGEAAVLADAGSGR